MLYDDLIYSAYIVKAQTASMLYTDPRTNTRYLLNMIDTPGHIDFNYEGNPLYFT